MKDARYLIRIANSKGHKPSSHADLLAKARVLAGPIKGKAINLRVSPTAIEFDLFCSPDAEVADIKSALARWGDVITCKRLDVPTPSVEPEHVIDEARQLFNEHRFWEVHEVLEGLWKELDGQEKQLVQGLILAAAALVHAQKNEDEVMWHLMDDALKRLEGQPPVYYSWNIAQFRDDLTLSAAMLKLKIPTV